MADDDLPPIEEIFADPNFRQLPAHEKINALDRYEDFKGLPRNEKVNAIVQGLQKIPMKGAPKPPPGFWGTIGEDLSGMAGAVRQKAHELRHPYETALQEPIFVAQQGQAAREAWRKGQYGQAVKDIVKGGLGPTGTAIASESMQQLRKARGEASSAMDPRVGPIKRLDMLMHAGGEAAGAFPVIGPAAAQAGEEYQRGETGRATAHTLELIGPDIVSGGLALAGMPLSAARRSWFASHLSGTQAARFAEAERNAAQAGYKGMVVTRGEKLGSATGAPSWLEKIERRMPEIPGAHGPAEEAYSGRAAELERQARQAVAKVAPASQPGIAAFDIATDVHSEAGQVIQRTKNAATRIYDVDIPAQTPTQRILLGSRRLPDGSFEKIWGEYKAPVPLKPYRQGLRPLYNEYRSRFKNLTEAERMADPGYSSLHHIMTDEDPLTPGRLRQYIGAMDLEKELGGIKQLFRRDQMSGFLHTPSGRIQLRIINNGEKLIAQALERAKPGLSAQLAQARRLTVQYKTADRLVTKILGRVEKGMPLEAMPIYEAMTAAKDKRYASSVALKRLAPKASQALARSYLEGLIETATKDIGKVKGGTGVGLVNGFNKLGPKTKQLFFGPLKDEIETAFENIKSLTPAEGAPTAGRYAALATIGAGMEILEQFLTGKPASAAGTAFHTGMLMWGANIFSRMLFRPGGGTAISRMIRAAKIGGVAFREASRAFEARVAVAQDEQREADAARARQADIPEAPAAATTPAAQPQAAQEPPTPEPAMPVPSETAGLPRPTGLPIPIPPALGGPSAAPAPPAQAAVPPPSSPAQVPVAAGRAGLAPGANPVAPSQRGVPYESTPPPRRPISPEPRAAAAPNATPAPRVAGFPDSILRIINQKAQGRVPPALVRAVAEQESRGNAFAEGPRTKTGERAQGVMQLMPATQRQFNVQNPFDPEQNIEGGISLLEHLLGKYRGDLRNALAAYYWGERNVDQWKQRNPGKPKPRQIEIYVSEVLRRMNRGAAEQAMAAR